MRTSRTLVSSSSCDCGLQALWWQPWQPDCIFHDNHHQHFHVNFGFNIKYWDTLHGTVRQKDKIYREDIFWGKGKDVNDATRSEMSVDIIIIQCVLCIVLFDDHPQYKLFSDEIEADKSQREDENPLAYSNNKNKYL